MQKLPAIQFYPADWRKDPGVQSLSFHDRAVWFEIICLMHESPRRGYLLLPTGKAITIDQLSRLVGLDNQNLESSLTNLLDCGVASRDEETGAIVNRRMVRDEEIRKIRKNAGSMGGNPILVNQNSNQNHTPLDKQKPTPSSSSSSSTTVNRERENTHASPSVDEACQYCKGHHLPTDSVNEWHSHRESQGWVKGNNQPITNWQADLKSWIYRNAREAKPTKAKTADQSKFADAF